MREQEISWKRLAEEWRVSETLEENMQMSQKGLHNKLSTLQKTVKFARRLGDAVQYEV